MGEHVDWALSRAKMAVGMGQLSEAVYGNSQLPVREREAARYTIALINECLVCKDTRAKAAGEAKIDEGFYGEVASWRTSTVLTEREKLAAEFAQRFAIDHLAMDDEFWGRLRGAFATTRSRISRSRAACSSAWAARSPSSACRRPRSESSSDRGRVWRHKVGGQESRCGERAGRRRATNTDDIRGTRRNNAKGNIRVRRAVGRGRTCFHGHRAGECCE